MQNGPADDQLLLIHGCLYGYNESCAMPSNEPSGVNSRTTTTDTQLERASAAEVSGYLYSDTFYRYIESGSLRSAAAIVPLVLRELSPMSVLDVGCGAGAWLSEYQNHGIADFLGVDGAYVQPRSLLISAERFKSLDVAGPFDLGRRFDIVQCLEVGEHLPESCSNTLVENLTTHGDKIVFSAATPGQGGENHINEQSPEFWRLLFARHGYKPFDPFRPIITGNAAVESWYRRNIILYVATTSIPGLSATVRHSAIPDDRTIPVMASWTHRILARLLSLLPVWCVSKIALVKHKIIIAYRSFKIG
jgi:SAM-dependent methyltransferase